MVIGAECVGGGVESMDVMPSKEHIYGLFKGMHCF